MPGAPLSLQAAPGHRQVRLRWTPAATRGAAIDSYQVRVDAGHWSTVPGLGAARDTTIAGLTNGTSYTFEVRAHNRVGAGAAASAEVAPAGGPGPATLAADPGDRQVERTCTEAAPNGAEVKLYRYRYRYRGASGWTGRDWHRVAGQGAARDTTLTGLSNGTLLHLRGAGHNREGSSRPDTETAKPVNRAPTCIGPETVSGPERTRRVGTCTCSDPDPGDPVTRSHRQGQGRGAVCEVRWNLIRTNERFETRCNGRWAATAWCASTAASTACPSPVWAVQVLGCAAGRDLRPRTEAPPFITLSSAPRLLHPRLGQRLQQAGDPEEQQAEPHGAHTHGAPPLGVVAPVLHLHEPLEDVPGDLEVGAAAR